MNHKSDNEIGKSKTSLIANKNIKKKISHNIVETEENTELNFSNINLRKVEKPYDPESTKFKII